MYRRLAKGWLKHGDFLVLDIICAQIAYVFAFWIRNGLRNPYDLSVYRDVAIVLILIEICVDFLGENHKSILKRGYWQEFKAVFILTLYVAATEGVYLFMTKQGDEFSRVSFGMFAALHLGLVYIVRLGWKYYLNKHGNIFTDQSQILLITSSDMAEGLAEHFKSRGKEFYHVLGIALLESSALVNKLPYDVVAVGAEEIYSYIQNKWIDEVIVSVPGNIVYPTEIVETIEQMGITVHLCLPVYTEVNNQHIVEKICGIPVVTSCINGMTPKQVFMKKMLDIVGSVVGLIFTGILAIIIGPMIYITSPGPIFFSQTRIGKNGKPFQMYKFRSMYPDAEKHKQELVGKNKMKGFMFKVDRDPRIIGSGPDGTRHGIGWFIRKTSIDEFPQFWNVLKGDMSLVGTRPPTVDEWEQYGFHHRARLAAKPGITGLWQISGRSDVLDFETVVKLDMEYMRDWKFGDDIKILFQTILVVLRGEGSA